MGLHATVDWKNGVVDFWGCTTSGCIRYEETQHDVHASIEDVHKNGLKSEVAVFIRKREGYDKLIRTIFSEDLLKVVDIQSGAKKADEEVLVKAYHYVAEGLKQGMRYVGVKHEYVSQRGIRVYYRIRYAQKSDGIQLTVEMVAEKDGERVSYTASGTTTDITAPYHEMIKAIGAYILFSNFVFQDTLQTNQT